MDLFTKLFLISLLIAFIIFTMLQYNVLKEAADKELFEINYNEANFGSAGDIATSQQGDMDSEGAMSDLDDLDGTGTGSKPTVPYTVTHQPFPEPDSGKPNGSYPPLCNTTLTEGRTHNMETLGTQPSVKSFDHQYNAQGDINKPNTYYYLETDNINKPCKKHMDCPAMKCSESGFCKY